MQSLGLGLFAASLVLSSVTVPSLAQSTLDPAVKAALDEGKNFEQRHQLTSALDSDRKGLKLSKNSCADCYEAIVNLQLVMDQPKDAASTAGNWIQHAGTPIEKSHAEYLQALALSQLDLKHSNPDALRQAADELKRAAQENPADAEIHMLRGRVLAALKLDDEAKAEFVACAATPGASPVECTRANNFAANIDLARGEPAPNFKLSGPDGTPISLDSLAGKVVLIDFWATWCQPCNKDLPYIQSIAHEFRKDQFVLLGVSSDSSESAWNRYIKENDMLGIQIRDSFEGLNSLFHVSGIPTYVVIDANGVIRLRVTGTEGDIRGKIRALLTQAHNSTPSLQDQPTTKTP